MGYTFCVPLKTKTVTEVVQVYVDNGCATLDCSSVSRISCLHMFTARLGVEHKIYFPHIIHSEMKGLKASVNFLRHVYLDISPNQLNGIKWYS